MKLTKAKRIRGDYEQMGFWLLLLVMAVYYGYRLFALTPWYDELYTYYFFVSRGPVYAAIHWPVPNNHVGYSVLSGFLDYCGNSYIGLRGVSFLCALANMVLLFQIGRHYLAKGLSLMTVILYVSMNLVNQLAVQGRGYTLGVTCFLTSFLCLIRICREGKCRKRYYIAFALSLVLGLYTLTSDIYWVLPVCFTGGIYLLYLSVLEAKENGKKLHTCQSAVKLVRLIGASLAAAAMTILLYAIIWLAIGSNLLVKEDGSIYYGMGHVQLILKAPFQALAAGMDYMLSTPYIQSVEREGFLPRLGNWLLTLFNYFYGGFFVFISILVICGIGCLFLMIVNGMRKKEKERILFLLFLLTGILCLPLFLLIQCALPYFRVFVYSGILMALLIAFLVQKLITGLVSLTDKMNKERLSGMVTAVFLILAAGLAVSCFGWQGYQNQYGMREHDIQDALSHSGIQQADNICVTDCTQQYMIKFLYNIICENTQIEGTDFLLLDRKMTDPDYQELEWEFYHYYNSIPWEYVNNNMIQIYENENFLVYTKKE